MDRALTTAPFSLLELTFRRAVVSVLDKPQWWLKWQDPTIRTKWLRELRDGFVRQTVEQSQGWKLYWGCTILRSLKELAVEQFSPSKLERADEWLRFMCFDTGYYPGKYAHGQPGVPDELDPFVENSWLREQDYRHFNRSSGASKPHHLYGLHEVADYMNVYVYIQWYLAIAHLQAQLAALPVEQWSEATVGPLLETAEQRSAPVVREQFVAFVLSLPTTRELTDDDVRTALGSITEVRPKAIELLLARCKPIQTELQQLDAHLIQALDSYAALVSTDSVGDATSHASPTGVYGAWRSDDAISSAIKAKFVSEVALLEDVPEELKDWHPNTDKQVLDIVHPSLYCAVDEHTKRIREPLSLDAFASPSEHMVKITGAETQSNTIDNRNWDRFQWLPSDVAVAADGSVRILSYINNFHPTHHAQMYSSLEHIFARFVPMFEHALSDVKLSTLEPTFEVPDSEMVNQCRPSFPESSAFKAPADNASFVTLRGKTLQVIVKIAEILLTPERPTYDGGSWHIEGTDAEQIVATGIYYFASDNIKDSRLSFRVQVKAPRYEQSDDSGMAIMYGLENRAPLAQVLGSVSTLEDRCLVFPNGLQHCVSPFRLDDPAKPGVRKILAFFLVDPDVPIVSTAVVPPQQESWVRELQEAQFQGVQFPVDVAEQVVREMVASTTTMSLDEALEHRLELMRQRSVYAPNDWFDKFNLCEH